MSDEGNEAREREVGRRIAGLIRSIGQAPQKQISSEEQQKLEAAANRLDRMLKAAADADHQALKDAAGRLDRLLMDIRKGKDVTSRLKRAREQQEPSQ